MPDHTSSSGLAFTTSQVEASLLRQAAERSLPLRRTRCAKTLVSR